jgi:hypothetical protein
MIFLSIRMHPEMNALRRAMLNEMDDVLRRAAC